MNYERNQNRIFILILVLSCLFLNISSTTTAYINNFNYDKGGENWPKSCKGDEQSPIDITGPFSYKSKNSNFNK